MSTSTIVRRLRGFLPAGTQPAIGFSDWGFARSSYQVWIVASILAFWGGGLSATAGAQDLTTRVSLGPAGVQGNSTSRDASLSADGRFVAFESLASNLVPVDANDDWDIFVHDRLTGATTRISVGPGGVEADGGSLLPTISADGRFVAFESDASNLVLDDTNNMTDVFLHDRVTGTTTRVSVATGGEEGNGASRQPTLSGDGRFVAFYSAASNLVSGDSNNTDDVFVHDRVTATTTRVSVGPAGAQGDSGSYVPFLSAAGGHVAFASYATNLVAGDTNGVLDVFVHDLGTGTTTRVSVGTGGVQGDGHSLSPVLSTDGRFVAFYSHAGNLVAGDTNGASDVFVHDQLTATTTRISVGAGGVQGNGDSRLPAMSADGRFVAFHSEATTLVAGDTNGARDVFVHDRVTGTTMRVSLGPAGVQGNNHSHYPAISGDGRFVGFDSSADNLVPEDTNGMDDVFVHDREGGARAPLPAGDYDGDGRSDVAVYRPSTGVWYIVRSTTGLSAAIPWGTAEDIPAPADYDGDGRTDIAVYRPSTGVWWIIPSTTGVGVGIRWGTTGDVPVPADYDGDGKADPAVFRPANGVWYQLRSATGAGYSVPWGTVGDVPVIADYDGDRRADPTVFRPSTGTWWQLRSTTGTAYAVRYGEAGDSPLAADWDRDGRADPTIYRGSTGMWYQLRSTTGTGHAVHWGTLGDMPVSGDYDGDGYGDPTVFRPSNGTWYQLRSLSGTWVGVHWGTWGDLPQ